MATVCETPKAKATFGLVHESKGCEFAINADDMRALIAGGTWSVIMTVATGVDCSDATQTNAAEHAAHCAAIEARFMR